jgi:hypothetical protein
MFWITGGVQTGKPARHRQFSKKGTLKVLQRGCVPKGPVTGRQHVIVLLKWNAEGSTSALPAPPKRVVPRYLPMVGQSDDSASNPGILIVNLPSE